MAIISRLGVVLGLDSAEFNAGLGKAETGVKKFEAVAGYAKAGIAALGAAFVASAYQAIQFADQMDELATANGMATGTILELSQALATNGGKVEDVGKLLATLTNKIDEAATGSQKTRDKFQQLGISLDDLGRLSETDLLRKTIDGLTKIEDPITRNALKFDLLGKAARSVDINGLNAEFTRLQGTMEGSDESFAKIAKSLDRIEVLSQQFKIDMAQNIAEPTNLAVGILEKFYATMKSGNAILGEQAEKLKQYGISLKDVFLFNTMFTLRLGQAFAKRGDQTGSTYSPPTDTAEYKPDFNVSNAPRRKIEQTPEQIAAAKKARLDAEKELQDAAKDTAQWAIKREQEERTERENRAREVAQMVIKQSEFYRLTVEQAVLDKERLDYQKTLVGLSDTQRDKAMALYDIEKELVLIQRQNPAFSEDMIERIRQVKTEAVLAQEEFMRAQNTFQAGWSRAYENFAERARDSAAIGASAFQSMSSSMESSLDQFVRTGKLSFSDLINSMISDLLRMMLKAQATSLFGSVFGNFFGGGGSGIFTGSTGAVGGSIHVGARAEGGDINAGLPYLVGERGAELIVPKSSGTVIPNHSLSQMMGSQPQTVYNGTVVQNMSAIDTQSAVQFLAQNKQAVWSANQSAQRSLPMSRG
jgi:lambda family phage tail tape measure protein